MIYGSVCSGIEAATVAWEPLGWKPAFYSEIDKNPRKVLQHHYPDVPLHGDFTTIEGGQYAAIDLLAGGTPCQSYSVAGKRAGLDDPRGELSLEFVSLAKRLQPRWIVWENVPGVLSTNGGRDFATFVRALAECGYGWAYRVLDAKHFGEALPRKRIWLIGYIGDFRFPASVLFERSYGEVIKERSKKGSRGVTLTTRNAGCRNGRGNAIVTKDGRLRVMTPVETERALSFPDFYTKVMGVSENQRYKMLGNSWSVKSAKWLGERIDFLENNACALRRPMR